MTKLDEILDKHLSLMVSRAEQSYASVDEMKKQPEYQTVKDAMIEFAKHILEEAANEAYLEQVPNTNEERVNKQSITDTLNKYL